MQGLKRIGFASFQSVPEAIEFGLEGGDQGGIGGGDEVFGVFAGGAAGPVVAAVEEIALVEEGELVVHVRGAAVGTDWDSVVGEFVDVGAEIAGLVVVGEDADRGTPEVGLDDGLGDAVVGDGEDADVGRLAGLVESVNDFSPAGVAGAEASDGAGRRGRGRVGGGEGVEQAKEFLEPVEDEGIVWGGTGEVEGSGSPEGAALGMVAEGDEGLGEGFALGSGESEVVEGVLEESVDFGGIWRAGHGMRREGLRGEESRDRTGKESSACGCVFGGLTLVFSLARGVASSVRGVWRGGRFICRRRGVDCDVDGQELEEGWRSDAGAECADPCRAVGAVAGGWALDS